MALLEDPCETREKLMLERLQGPKKELIFPGGTVAEQFAVESKLTFILGNT